MMGKVLTDTPIPPGEGILHHAEGVYRMVKEQFEMNSYSLNAYESMLREACRSWAENNDEEKE